MTLGLAKAVGTELHKISEASTARIIYSVFRTSVRCAGVSVLTLIAVPRSVFALLDGVDAHFRPVIVQPSNTATSITSNWSGLCVWCSG